mgnify:CR=1 FL=1
MPFTCRKETFSRQGPLIWDCASIYCNQEQRGVLETLVEDVAYLGSMRREKEKNEEEDASLVTAINAIQYGDGPGGYYPLP